MKWIVIVTTVFLVVANVNAAMYHYEGVPCTPGETFTHSDDFDVEPCTECTCYEIANALNYNGAYCRGTISVPTEFDTENCERHFDEEKCLYTVTRKDNPDEPCEVTGAVLN